MFIYVRTCHPIRKSGTDVHHFTRKKKIDIFAYVEVQQQRCFQFLQKYVSLLISVKKNMWLPPQFKATQSSFSTLKLSFHSRFYDSLTCNRQNSTPVVDTAPPAGAASPVSCGDTLHALALTLLSWLKEANSLVSVWDRRCQRDRRRSCRKRWEGEEERVAKSC